MGDMRKELACFHVFYWTRDAWDSIILLINLAMSDLATYTKSVDNGLIVELQREWNELYWPTVNAFVLRSARHFRAALAAVPAVNCAKFPRVIIYTPSPRQPFDQMSRLFLTYMSETRLASQPEFATDGKAVAPTAVAQWVYSNWPAWWTGRNWDLEQIEGW